MKSTKSSGDDLQVVVGVKREKNKRSGSLLVHPPINVQLVVSSDLKKKSFFLWPAMS